LWALLYQTPIDAEIDERWELAACKHAKLTSAEYLQAKAKYPQWWDKMLQKRARRLAYYREHGQIRKGWTPPDPNNKDRRQQIDPIHVHLKRRKSETAKLYFMMPRIF
jgi:hypothetical protein